METEIVELWESKKNKVREAIIEKVNLDDYADIVKTLVNALWDDKEGYDTDKMTVVDDGDYQGTLLFLIPKGEYQPYNYLFFKVGYGSCSGCDTLQSIISDTECDGEVNPKLSEQQVSDYMMFCLHLIQSAKYL